MLRFTLSAAAIGCSQSGSGYGAFVNAERVVLLGSSQCVVSLASDRKHTKPTTAVTVHFLALQLVDSIATSDALRLNCCETDYSIKLLNCNKSNLLFSIMHAFYFERKWKHTLDRKAALFSDNTMTVQQLHFFPSVISLGTTVMKTNALAQ